MSSGLIQPPVDGEFYIDNDNDDFYLRENGAWGYKGRLFRDDVVAFISPGPYPFVAQQTFELAMGSTAVRYYQGYSGVASKVAALYPAAADCVVTFTNNLADFLGHGTSVICSAAIAAGQQQAALTFNDTTVPAFTPLWLVMPETADVAMAGMRAVFVGEPA